LEADDIHLIYVYYANVLALFVSNAEGAFMSLPYPLLSSLPISASFHAWHIIAAINEIHPWLPMHRIRASLRLLFRAATEEDFLRASQAKLFSGMAI
jgi:hypothetical protein